MLTYKPGVKVNKNGPLKPLIEVLERVSELHGEIVVTSGNDGKHAQNSYHYHDRAVDIRSRGWDGRRLCQLMDAIRAACPSVCVRIEIEPKKSDHYWYTGIWRPIGVRGPNEHIHIEVRG